MLFEEIVDTPTQTDIMLSQSSPCHFVTDEQDELSILRRFVCIG
jgi:hypothetical protein